MKGQGGAGKLWCVQPVGLWEETVPETHEVSSLELMRLPILRVGLFSESRTVSQAETAKNLIGKEKRQMTYKEPRLGRHLISPQGSCGSSKTGQSYHLMLEVNNS